MNWNLDYKKLGFVAVLALIIIFREYLIASLLPFFAAFLLAGLIDPVVNQVQSRLRVPRSAAVMATLLSLILIAGYLLTIIFAKIAAELVDLASLLPAYQQTLVLVAEELIRNLNQLIDDLPRQVNVYLQNAIDDLSQKAVQIASDMIDRTLGTITALPGLMVVFIITMLATYFFSKDKDLMSKTLMQIAPPRWQAPLNEAKDKILVDLIDFIKAQALLLTMTTIVAAVGLFFVGTRYWMILAISLGILDLIPVMGPGLILFPWIGLSLFLGQPAMAAQLFALFLIIFALRQVAQAKILGDSIGVHPLAMLVALYAGIILFGVKGIIVGPMLVIIGKAVWHSGVFRVDHSG